MGHREAMQIAEWWLTSAGTSVSGRAMFEFWLWHLLTGDPSQRVWPQGCIRKRRKGIMLGFTFCRAVVSCK